MMRTLLLLTPLLCWAASSPSEEAEVKAVLEKTFRAMSAHDGELLRSTMLPDARLYSVRDDGAPATRSLDEFVKQIVGTKTDLVERFTGRPKVMIRARIAQLWGEYEFLRDGKFSHCGIDTAVLFKQANTWKIASLSYTVETKGCKGQPKH